MKLSQPTVRRYNPNLPESESLDTIVIVFICPTQGCGNYFAAGNLSPDDRSLDEMQYKRIEDGDRIPTRTRRECPDCYDRDGIRVPRDPFVVTEVLPYNSAVRATLKQIKN